MLRALIVDDEHLARSSLRRALATDKTLEVVGEAGSISEALTLLREKRPNIIFLDIELGSGDVFEFISLLDDPPMIVFVTAHAEYAVDAFGLHAVDYLLKPVTKERMTDALSRAKSRLSHDHAADEPVSKTIEVRVPGRIYRFPESDIVAIKSEGDFVRLFHADGGEIMILNTLSTYEKLLSSPPFFKIGRSLILNLDRLRRIEATARSGSKVTMEGAKEPINLGLSATTRLRKILTSMRQILST